MEDEDFVGEEDGGEERNWGFGDCLFIKHLPKMSFSWGFLGNLSVWNFSTNHI